MYPSESDNSSCSDSSEYETDNGSFIDDDESVSTVDYTETKSPKTPSSDTDSDESVLESKNLASAFNSMVISPTPKKKKSSGRTDSTEGEVIDCHDGKGWKDDADNFVHSSGLKLPCALYDRLYSYQVEGVKWMASLYQKGVGGILGDDMGMGKTFQTLSFIGGMMNGKKMKNALVVCPLSLLRTWEKEAHDILRACVPGVKICVLSSDMGKDKRSVIMIDALTCSSRSPYLILTTYGLVSSDPDLILPRNYINDTERWDCVVLDEGHTIKNARTKVNKGCHKICKRGTMRLLLTGTPIQNNLKELWTLFDWATAGKLLGGLPMFKNKFGNPIEDGRHKDASEVCIAMANQANIDLQDTLHPHFIQRMKNQIMTEELPSKQDKVIWTHLSTKQRSMYEEFVKDDLVQSVILGETQSPLTALTWLKKLCSHPTLVDDDNPYSSDQSDIKELLQESPKLQLLVDLISHLKEGGHRTLIFSQSTKVLDIIEQVLSPIAKLGRIDGSTKEVDRQSYVERFNKEGSKIVAMLCSTRAAGLGLTLTGADRVVIYDPSWNPADDSQASDRCYRIGQKRNVIVYRLVTSGTVEERMYEKQVHKGGISRAVLTGSGAATERYFAKADLRRLFKLAPIGVCDMMDKMGQLLDGDNLEGKINEFQLVNTHRAVVGLTAHDLLYTNQVVDVEEGGKGKERGIFDGTKARRKVPSFTNEQNDAVPLGGGTMMNKTRQVRDEAKQNRTNKLGISDGIITKKTGPLFTREQNEAVPLGRGTMINKTRQIRDAAKQKKMKESGLSGKENVISIVESEDMNETTGMNNGIDIAQEEVIDLTL